MTFLRSRRRWHAIGVILGCSFWFAAASYATPVREYSVANLGQQTVLTSGNRQLSFTNFHFKLGSQRHWGCDGLSDFTLTVLDDGIRLTGPISVSHRASASLKFSYDVSVLGNATGIGGVSLFAPSETSDDCFPALVKTDKRIYAGSTPHSYHEDPLAILKTRNFGDHYSEFDSETFAPEQELHVVDRIRLSSGGRGSTATLEEITNRFSVVPEPTTLALLGMGVLGLGIAGRRR